MLKEPKKGDILVCEFVYDGHRSTTGRTYSCTPRVKHHISAFNYASVYPEHVTNIIPAEERKGEMSTTLPKPNKGDKLIFEFEYVQDSDSVSDFIIAIIPGNNKPPMQYSVPKAGLKEVIPRALQVGDPVTYFDPAGFKTIGWQIIGIHGNFVVIKPKNLVDNPSVKPVIDHNCKVVRE